MSTTSTYDLASSLAAQFDDGAWVLAQSRQAHKQTAKLAEETRDLILTFRSHRFHPIAGADDHADDLIRRRLREFASCGTVRTFVGPSRGAVCDACGKKIFIGEIEYELVASNGSEIRLNGDCYELLVNELPMLQRARNGAGGDG